MKPEDYIGLFISIGLMISTAILIISLIPVLIKTKNNGFGKGCVFYGVVLLIWVVLFLIRTAPMNY